MIKMYIHTNEILIDKLIYVITYHDYRLVLRINKIKIKNIYVHMDFSFFYMDGDSKGVKEKG